MLGAVVLGAASGAVGGAGGAAVAPRGGVKGGAADTLSHVGVAGVAGALVGAYVALEVVPQQTILQVKGG